MRTLLRFISRSYVATLCLAIAAPASPALASPWTLKRGELAVVAGTSYQRADSEYLVDGKRQDYPLQGEYNAVDVYMNARFGITDDWELELGMPFRVVNYEADSVILLPTDETGADAFDHYQDNTLNFSRTQRGLGDLTVVVRRRVPILPIPFALELRLKTPTGYARPSGTFGERPKSSADFLARAAELVNAENIEDDVTLGDGQLDLQAQALFGYATSHGTFVRFDSGFNLRLGGAGDELKGSLKIGQAIEKIVLVYAGVDGTYAVQRGRVIGISVVAQDPSIPANDFGRDPNGALNPLFNLDTREVTLDRDAVDLGAGVILRLVPGAEINIGYHRTLWGRNTAIIDGFYIGFGTRLSTME